MIRTPVLALVAAGLIVTAGCGGKPTGAADQATPATASSTPEPIPSNYDYDTGSPPPELPETTDPLPSEIPSQTPLPPGRAGVPRGLPAYALRPDRSKVDEVAVAFALLISTHDALLDNRPADAGPRAAAVATARLAGELRGSRPVGSPGAAWNQLELHQGYTRVTATDTTEDGAPPDSATTAMRGIKVVAVPTAAGWTGTTETTVVFLELTRPGPGHPWAVDSYDAQV